MPNESDWVFHEEPHAARRREILKAHPEIGKLPKRDPRIAVIVAGQVLLQILMCKYIVRASWPVLLVCSYVVSATLNHSLGSAIHEIGHNLAFGQHHPYLNRYLAMMCNLPIFIPMAISYKRYHADHHRYMGHDTLDVDVPTWIEIKYVRHPLFKFIWLLFHPVIHGIRPYFKAPKVWNFMELLNFCVQVGFDVLILKVFGAKACIYLALGTFFGLGAHPLAAHFFSEHYMFTKNMATMSYYGPLNFFLFNVGYHNEHHDFPNVPYTSLPEIKRIAPEFYDDLPNHPSWLRVLWDFVFDPNMGPHAHGIGYLKSDLDESSATKTPSQASTATSDTARHREAAVVGCFYGDDDEDRIYAWEANNIKQKAS